jgi:hypothetical protein
LKSKAQRPPQRRGSQRAVSAPATRPTGSLLQFWPYLYVLVLLPCLVYTIFYTARAIRLDYTPVPIWDSWRSVQFVDKLLKFDLAHFWVQHNEHRIIFPEMFFALDYIFLHGRQILPAACNVVCQFVQLGILWWLLKKMTDVPLAIRLTLGLCCGLLMTTAMQVQGILGTFLIQWYLSQAAAALSLLFLWLSASAGRISRLVLSIAAAIVVTYSSGNGMVLWPVLVLMAVLLRLPKGRIAAVTVAGILSIAVYFVGYKFLGQGRTAILLAHPFYATWFVGVYLGVPVSYYSARLGGFAGLAGLVSVIAAVIAAMRQRRSNDPALTVAAGVCLFIAGSALIAAYGRMEPDDPGFGTAMAARYISVPLTYWANLVVATAWLAMRLPRLRRVALHVVTAGFVAVVLVAVVARQQAYERIFAAQQAHGHESGIALEAGIDDSDTIRVIFPDPQFVRETMPAIQQRRLSIFAPGHQDWIGRQLNRAFLAGPADLCSGSIDNLSTVTGGYRAAGWAIDRRADRAAENIALTNSAGTIVGIGETRPGGYPGAMVGPTVRSKPEWDWIGYARADTKSRTLQAYAIVNHGQTACALGSPRPVPHGTPINPSLVGAPIHVQWKADPAWTLNGFHPSVGSLTGQILYGSYSGNDANEGSLVSAPFATTGVTCLALPIAHGPSVGGQSVRLVDAGTGKTIESIPLSLMGGSWQYWAVDSLESSKLQIVAEDKGNQWGQWVAVGEPHSCKSH